MSKPARFFGGFRVPRAAPRDACLLPGGEAGVKRAVERCSVARGIGRTLPVSRQRATTMQQVVAEEDPNTGSSCSTDGPVVKTRSIPGMPFFRAPGLQKGAQRRDEHVMDAPHANR